MCLSVTTPAPTSLVSTLKIRYVGVYRKLFSINPTIQKLWHEKDNMQMSVYLSRPVLAGFEYRACISRYLKAEH